MNVRSTTETNKHRFVQYIDVCIGLFALGISVVCLLKGISFLEEQVATINQSLTPDRVWTLSLVAALRFQLGIAFCYQLSVICFLWPKSSARPLRLLGYGILCVIPAILIYYSVWSTSRMESIASLGEAIDLLPSAYLVGLPNPWNYTLTVSVVAVALWGAASIIQTALSRVRGH